MECSQALCLWWHWSSLYKKKHLQTWQKWINILVNKYINDILPYWNVLLYIKYNTFLKIKNKKMFCLVFFFKQKSTQNIVIEPCIYKISHSITKRQFQLVWKICSTCLLCKSKLCSGLVSANGSQDQELLLLNDSEQEITI